MERYRALGLEGSSSLDAVCDKINLSRAGNLHGALEDAWLAMRVYLWLHDCPLNFDFPRSMPTEPINLRAVPRLPTRTQRRRMQEEIRLPEPISRSTARSQKRKSAPTQPISPQIEVRLEPANKLIKEIPVFQSAPPAIPALPSVVARGPQPLPASRQTITPPPSHNHPVPLGEKLEALFMLVFLVPFLMFMFVLPALFVAGIPAFVILTFVFDLTLPL
jgi:hypothetical protein